MSQPGKQDALHCKWISGYDSSIFIFLNFENASLIENYFPIYVISNNEFSFNSFHNSKSGLLKFFYYSLIQNLA